MYKENVRSDAQQMLLFVVVLAVPSKALSVAQITVFKLKKIVTIVAIVAKSAWVDRYARRDAVDALWENPPAMDSVPTLRTTANTVDVVIMPASVAMSANEGNASVLLAKYSVNSFVSMYRKIPITAELVTTLVKWENTVLMANACPHALLVQALVAQVVVPTSPLSDAAIMLVPQ